MSMVHRMPANTSGRSWSRRTARETAGQEGRPAWSIRRRLRPGVPPSRLRPIRNPAAARVSIMPRVRSVPLVCTPKAAVHPGGQCGADGGGLCQQRCGAGEQRFAAVQIDPDLAQPVGAGVFGDALGGLLHGGGRDRRRAGAPAAVQPGVDVAVGAGEVAAAVDLEHELPEGHDSGRAGLLPRHGSPPALVCLRRGTGAPTRRPLPGTWLRPRAKNEIHRQLAGFLARFPKNHRSRLSVHELFRCQCKSFSRPRRPW